MLVVNLEINPIELGKLLLVSKTKLFIFMRTSVDEFSVWSEQEKHDDHNHNDDFDDNVTTRILLHFAFFIFPGSFLF